MTGVEAVAALRAAGRDDFVVGVTGNALLSDQEEYLAAGVDQCVLPWWCSAAWG
jgi:osomolarity two-component system sensor histidine kinase SLN1